MMSSTTRSRSKFLLRVKYKSRRAISPALRLLRSLHAITQINQLHSVLANGTVAVSNGGNTLDSLSQAHTHSLLSLLDNTE